MSKRYYKSNKIKHQKSVSDREKRVRLGIASIKTKYGCCICDEKCTVCLDFHHLENKSFEISKSYWFGVKKY
jgi:hypothetical protein